MFMNLSPRIFGLIFILVAGSPSLSAKHNLQDTLNKHTENYINLEFSNDIFFKTDYYFTHGFLLELQIERLALRLSDRLNLYTRKPVERRYNYNLQQNIYTPVNYTTDTINYHDRPYAGTLSLSYKEEIYIGNTQNTFGISIGALGKPSGAEQIQNFIHSVIHNNLSIGWDNQINTDIIINFHYTYCRRLVSSEYFDFTGSALINAGTLNTDLSGKLNFRLGKYNHRFGDSGPLKTNHRRENWQYYLYLGIIPKLVLFNATLQGGVINRSKDEHVFTYDQIENLVLGIEWGLVIGYRGFLFAFRANSITPEFEGGKPHAFASLQLKYLF